MGISLHEAMKLGNVQKGYLFSITWRGGSFRDVTNYVLADDPADALNFFPELLNTQRESYEVKRLATLECIGITEGLAGKLRESSSAQSS